MFGDLRSAGPYRVMGVASFGGIFEIPQVGLVGYAAWTYAAFAPLEGTQR